MPSEALYALISANPDRTVSMHAVPPDPSEIGTLLTSALKATQSRGRQMQLRDETVITILRVLWRATSKAPTIKNSEPFIELIEHAYTEAGLLLDGLRVRSSRNTFHRLVQRTQALGPAKTCTQMEQN